jgi:antitoxin YobK
MKYNEIKGLIDQLGDRVEFFGKADEDRIRLIEKNLDTSLSESYKWFLQEFGLALISPFKILGNGLSDTPSCVRATMSWRKYGLAKHLIVIEEEDEWIYCLDTSKMIKGECPVVDWVQGKGVGNVYFDSFSSFFLTCLHEALVITGKYSKDGS